MQVGETVKIANLYSVWQKNKTEELNQDQVPATLQYERRGKNGRNLICQIKWNLCVYSTFFFPSYYKILYKYFYLLLMNYQILYSFLQQGVHLFISRLYLCCVYMCVIKLN